MALPPELPRVEVVHELPDNDHHCHKDSAALKIIGEEVIEKLHGLPARIEVTRHVRRKYACPTCEEGMKTAPAPPAKMFCLKAMPAPRCSPLYRDRQIPGRALP